jgi:alkaline phosphatase
MNRRKFFKNGSVFTLGSVLLNPFQNTDVPDVLAANHKDKRAKNIIMMVSDGMSSGTLTMTDLLLKRKSGTGSNWLNLYREQKAVRGLMDMASASSIVTDSAAASSSWGSGYRVLNGSLNVGVNGESYTPIWQKFKQSGKMAGCVTTVPVTHATPAGFCVNSKSRNGQADIAEQYLELEFDVLLGGGDQFFNALLRKDKKDLYAAYQSKGYQVARSRSELFQLSGKQPVLGIFAEDGLPYALDHANDRELQNNVPTLAEMTQIAIEHMRHHSKGFVLQVEGGKVDWAAHANCVGGLLYDQAAFDEAIKVVLDFAEKDGETLVIITSDHGNANPGVIYGKQADAHFDSIQTYRHTNEWILNGLSSQSTVSQVIERVEHANGYILTDDEAKTLLNYYTGITKDDGLYNYKKLPYKALSEMQKTHNAVGWISMDHSSDYTEIAMVGPGSERLTPFIKNTDLHQLLLKAAQVMVGV